VVNGFGLENRFPVAVLNAGHTARKVPHSFWRFNEAHSRAYLGDGCCAHSSRRILHFFQVSDKESM
jgi:hypothetical protein